ncbi:Uncharacterised protein [Actinobacillus lignieresii]|uniref:phage tail protein n=1 Tax=Actinobacillus lignieresii TaxID=720 RepID=UPI000F6ED9AC|nr:phage tail protein [Actinobacillus lignieresii]VEB25769.1 Uncharacterised protein [Actinobacillus lignieresii]
MTVIYEGSCVLEVDGQEVEITKLDVKTLTGRKLVKAMNSQGRAKGYTKGIKEYSLTITAVEPTDGTEIDWDNIENSKLTKYPLDNSEKRTSYLGCFSTEVGESYQVDGESLRDIQLHALRKVKE